MLVTPMAAGAEEAVGSMGTDTPLACLSDRPQLLFNYFKQLFAQVTSPPIDPIREVLVMSLETTIGPEQNLFEETPLHCRQLHLKSPTLSNEQLAQVKTLDDGHLRATTLPILFAKRSGGPGLRAALDDLCARASKAVADGDTILVLSDRGVDDAHVPIPSLLATAAVHHHLIREGTRMRCGIVIESGEPRAMPGCATSTPTWSRPRSTATSTSAASTSGAAVASTTPTTRTRSPSSSTRCAPPATRCSRSTRRR